MLPMIFVLPFVQLLILVNAATMDMRNIELVIVDQDISVLSRKLVSKFVHSPFFKIIHPGSGDASKVLLEDKADMILVIPRNFERDIYRKEAPKVQLQVDAINGMTAGLTYSYANLIITAFQRDIAAELNIEPSISAMPGKVEMDYLFWYNSKLKFKYYMVPGILTILLTVIGMFLASLNLVREKELGTIEQINVTPIKKYQFIIGKLLPFWMIALFELALGLTMGKLLFQIPIEGSLLLLFAYACIYLLAVLGLGLLISTFSETQQQAQFLNFFVLITFIMMSGIFTPAESMPYWAQQLNVLNPMAYFMRVVRMILLKGSAFADILWDFVAITILASGLLVLAIWRYRKVS
jgi:ABC-2 type transport system permease protein